jgi:cyclopropane-fatty-acyl-phospholipid synthase
VDTRKRSAVKGPDASENPPRKVLAADRWLVRRALSVLGHPPIRVKLWNGEELGQAENPVAHVHIHDRGALLKLVGDSDVGFGDAYCAGRIDVEGDLPRFLDVIYRVREAAASGLTFLAQPFRLLHRPRLNSLSGSRDNIHRHYDIGNEFYKLWLDDQMLYTCAYFPDPTSTLEAAQIAKMDHVCRKLQLRPGQLVVEAGCGWGGLARHMAQKYGVTVRAYNVSHEQIAFARERARVEGLDDRVEFVEDDYRNITGKYDAFVSVGMLEHVGIANYRELGDVIFRSLKPTGRGLIHSIGQNRSSVMNPWLERRIFPGAHLPTLREMMGVFEPLGFAVLDVENLRPHYAKTLDHWLQRFDRVADQVREMYDEHFVRAWRLYLAGSMASFTSGWMQLFQVVFVPPSNLDVEWTREHLYKGPATS